MCAVDASDASTTVPSSGWEPIEHVNNVRERAAVRAGQVPNVVILVNAWRWSVGAQGPELRAASDLETADVRLGQAVDVGRIAEARKLD